MKNILPQEASIRILPEKQDTIAEKSRIAPVKIEEKGAATSEYAFKPLADTHPTSTLATGIVHETPKDVTTPRFRKNTCHEKPECAPKIHFRSKLKFSEKRDEETEKEWERALGKGVGSPEEEDVGSPEEEELPAKSGKKSCFHIFIKRFL